MSNVTYPSEEQFFSEASIEAPSCRRRRLYSATLFAGLVVAVGTVAWVGRQASHAPAAAPARSNMVVAIAPKQLAPQYSDRDGSLVADSPANPAQLVDPDRLIVAHYEGDYEEEPRVNWIAFQRHISDAIGKPVLLREYMHTAEEVADVASGEIHVVAPHAADVPYLVNSAGLVPFAMLGTSTGANGNHMVIAVRPNSEIHSLQDLRGKTLTCTRPDSITGYRAAITTLVRQCDMRADVDFRFYYSHGQMRSIRGLTDGWYEAAALSHDKLQEALAEGVIDESQYRIVYESAVIPRLTIGTIHRLAPNLASQIRSAVLSFENLPSDCELRQTRMRFVPSEYKQDFEFVRKMDDSFDPRCGQRMASKALD